LTIGFAFLSERKKTTLAGSQPPENDGTRARGEEMLRTLLKAYDTLQPAKHNPGDDQEADERLAEVTAQLALLGALISIDQARLDTVYRVILQRDSEQPFVIHAYAVLQLYFASQLRTFDDMISFRQPRDDV
jgi:hypothetical protein